MLFKILMPLEKIVSVRQVASAFAEDAFGNQLGNEIVDVAQNYSGLKELTDTERDVYDAARKEGASRAEALQAAQRSSWLRWELPERSGEKSPWELARDEIIARREKSSTGSEMGLFADELSKEAYKLAAIGESIKGFDPSDPSSYEGLVSSLRQGDITDNPLYNILAARLGTGDIAGITTLEQEAAYVQQYIASADDRTLAGDIRGGTIHTAMAINDFVGMIDRMDMGIAYSPEVKRMFETSDWSSFGKTTLAGDIASALPVVGAIQAAELFAEKGPLNIMGEIGYLSPVQKNIQMDQLNKNMLQAGVGAVTGWFGRVGTAIDLAVNFGEYMVPKAEAGVSWKKTELAMSLSKLSGKLMSRAHQAKLDEYIGGIDISYGNVMERMGFPKPPNMKDAHGHHILYKKGNGPKQQALVKEGQAILREYGIDPFFGKENLVWAPNRVAGQHHVNDLTQTVNALKAAKATPGTDYQDIVKILRDAGIKASQRK